MLKGVVIGAGYFSQFHYDAWSRIEQVHIAALCDRDPERAAAAAAKYAIPAHYVDYKAMLDAERPDFVDIVTPPSTHLEICQAAAERGVAVICQKPLAPSWDEANAIVDTTRAAGIRFMVHENFRFQPWHREIKRLLEAGAIGDRLFSLTFRSRPGDGWGDDCYLGRQPYFRDMQRFLIHETGVHFIDTFRYLAGPIQRVYCVVRKLNPVIAGEDCGVLLFEFECDTVGTWDANRWNESNSDDPRYTFGEFLVEGSGGSIRLAMDGSLTLQPLGEPERPHAYVHNRNGFGGDCVLTTQRHFIEHLLDNGAFETPGDAYARDVGRAGGVLRIRAHATARRCRSITTARSVRRQARS